MTERYGPKVRWLRTGLRMSGRELCRRAAITPSYLSDIESGRRHPAPETSDRIADVLGADRDALWRLVLLERFSERDLRTLAPEAGETDLRERIAAEVRRWENGRGGDIVLGDIRALLTASPSARRCPCNGGCHNGHTRTCSEECRGQTVEHVLASGDNRPSPVVLEGAPHTGDAK